MSDSRQGEQERRGRLVGSQAFVQFLFHEIARYDRYGHSFAVLILEAPGEEDSPERRMALRRASGETRGLLRTCDLVAPFEDIGVLAVLLPETTATGARTVLQRFMFEPKELDADWTLKVAAYPDQGEVIEQLLALTEDLAEGGWATPETAEAPVREPSFLPQPFRPPPRPRARTRLQDDSTQDIERADQAS